MRKLRRFVTLFFARSPDQPQNPSIGNIGHQHVAIARIARERNDGRSLRDLLHVIGTDRLGAVGLQGPDTAKNVIGEKIFAFKIGVARTMAYDSSGDAHPFVMRIVPYGIVELRDGRDIGPKWEIT